jgi:hypothetical protein
MDKRSHWPFSIKKFPPSFDMPKPFEIDPVIIEVIYEERYKGNPGDKGIAIKAHYLSTPGPDRSAQAKM